MYEEKAGSWSSLLCLCLKSMYLSLSPLVWQYAHLEKCISNWFLLFLLFRHYNYIISAFPFLSLNPTTSSFLTLKFMISWPLCSLIVVICTTHPPPHTTHTHTQTQMTHTHITHTQPDTSCSVRSWFSTAQRLLPGFRVRGWFSFPCTLIILFLFCYNLGQCIH